MECIDKVFQKMKSIPIKYIRTDISRRTSYITTEIGAEILDRKLFEIDTSKTIHEIKT